MEQGTGLGSAIKYGWLIQSALVNTFDLRQRTHSGSLNCSRTLIKVVFTEPAENIVVLSGLLVVDRQHRTVLSFRLIIIILLIVQRNLKYAIAHYSPMFIVK